MDRDTFGFPMVYYAFGIFIGSLYAMTYKDSVVVATIFSIILIVIIAFTINYRDLIIVMCFFILGAASNFIYFDFKAPSSQCVEGRIVEQNEFNYVAKINGKLVQLDGVYNSDIREGSKVLIKGAYEKYPIYNRGVVARCKVEECTLNKDDFISKIYDKKRNFYLLLKEQMGEDKAAVVVALCLGDDAYISEEHNEKLKILGIVHAISVSGLHMAIIYTFIKKALGSNLALIGAFAFLIITGGKSATVRAFVMILVNDLAYRCGEKYSAYSALSISAIILIITRPFSAASPGFMLSFLGVIGILMFNHKIERAVYKLPKTLRSTIALGVSAQVFTFPYMAIVFGQGNINFILGNLILLPILTVVIVLGALALIFCKIPLVFIMLCKGMEFILICYEGYREILLKLSFEIMSLGYLDAVLFIVIITSFILMKKGHKKLVYVPLAFIIAVGISRYKFNVNISYFKMAYSDGILIEYKDKSTFICDDSKMIKNIEKVREIDNFVTVDNLKSCAMNLDEDFKVSYLDEASTKNSKNDILAFSCKDNIENVFVKDSKDVSKESIYGNYNIEVLPQGENRFYKNEVLAKYIIVGHRIIRIK